AAGTGVDVNRFNGNIYELRALAGLGRPAPVVVGANPHVFYAESDGSINHAWRDAAWHHESVAGAASGPGDAGAYAVGNVIHIVFRTGGGHIKDIVRNASDTAWAAARDLFTLAAGSGDAFGDPSGYVTPTEHHIVYWGDDDQVHELRS